MLQGVVAARCAPSSRVSGCLHRFYPVEWSGNPQKHTSKRGGGGIILSTKRVFNFLAELLKIVVTLGVGYVVSF